MAEHQVPGNTGGSDTGSGQGDDRYRQCALCMCPTAFLFLFLTCRTDAVLRLSDVIADAGRPVAFYPRLRAITGSTNATLLLCQLIYWCGKQRDSDGWVFKRTTLAEDDPDGREDPSNQSLAQETGLTYKELLVSRRLLQRRGFIHERHDYSRHRL
jgi:hypothetical protein